MSSPPLAVILSACRTPIGSFGGALKDLSAPDLGAIVVREAIARAEVPPADLGEVILGCVLQAAAGMNVARQAAIKAGVADRRARRNRQSRVRLGAAGRRARGRSRAHRLHRRRGRRRHRIDVERPVRAEGRALGPSHGARRNGRHDDLGRPHRRDAPVSHGPDRRRSRNEVQRLARGPGSLSPPRASAARRRRSPRARSATRSSPCRCRRRRASRCSSRPMSIREPGRRPTSWRRCGRRSRRTASVTAGNASGINDGAAAVVVATTAKSAALGQTALARILSYAVDRCRADGHGHRSGPGRAQGARPRRAGRGRHRPVRVERGVRGAVGRGRARARPRSGARSTSTAARSRLAIRSAPAARAC